MKTNRTLIVRYKVNYDDDSKFLSDKLTRLIKAHYKYCKDGGHTIPGDGRIALGKLGVVEWEIDEEERKREIEGHETS